LRQINPILAGFSRISFDSGGNSMRALASIPRLPIIALAVLSVPLAAMAQPGRQVSASPAELAASCESCHGPATQAASHAPRLNGQTREYLLVRLGELRNPINQTIGAIHNMSDPARALTETQMQSLADHFASQPATEANRRGPAHDRGALLFAKGRGQEIPSCATCHGDNGQGAGEGARLAGQHGTYLQDQMQAMMIAARVQGTMNKHVWMLTQQDVRDLAAYLGND
jgi:cytochrome c553